MSTRSKFICSDPVSADPLNKSNLQQNHLQLFYLYQVTCSRSSASNRTLTAKIGHLQRLIAATICCNKDHLQRNRPDVKADPELEQKRIQNTSRCKWLSCKWPISLQMVAASGRCKWPISLQVVAASVLFCCKLPAASDLL